MPLILADPAQRTPFNAFSGVLSLAATPVTIVAGVANQRRLVTGLYVTNRTAGEFPTILIRAGVGGAILYTLTPGELGAAAAGRATKQDPLRFPAGLVVPAGVDLVAEVTTDVGDCNVGAFGVLEADPVGLFPQDPSLSTPFTATSPVLSLAATPVIVAAGAAGQRREVSQLTATNRTAAEFPTVLIREGVGGAIRAVLTPGELGAALAGRASVQAPPPGPGLSLPAPIVFPAGIDVVAEVTTDVGDTTVTAGGRLED